MTAYCRVLPVNGGRPDMPEAVAALEQAPADGMKGRRALQERRLAGL